MVTSGTKTSKNCTFLDLYNCIVLLYKTKNKMKIIFLPNNIFDLTPPIFSKCSHNKHESVNVLMQFMRNETKLKKFVEDWPKIGPAILFNR